MLKKIGIGAGLIFGIIAVLLIAALIKTATVKSMRVKPLDSISSEASSAIKLVDKNRAAQNLAKMISIRTISSYSADKFDQKAFKDLRTFIDTNYIHASKVLEKEVINDMTLLYKWKGADQSKKAILLIAHQDVVPVEAGTEKDWKYPPFGNNVKDGYIWGRGAFDIKNSLAAIMEAVDALAASGFVPDATIYLAFGHDEEVGGRSGNKIIAELMKTRGVKLSVVMDEGGAVVTGAIPGIKTPVALIGIAEKGYVTLELTATGKGGHSSQPPKNTAAGLLAKAIIALETNQMSATLDGPAILTFDFLADEMPFGYKLLFSNKWLFNPLIKKVFLSSPATAAMIRTSTAVTVLKSGEKDNILPQKATALINFRIKPGDTVEDIVDHTKKLSGADISVEIYHGFTKPSSVSNPATKEFNLLRQTVASIYPDSVSAPYLVLGGTDSKYYDEIADNIFRFVPISIKLEELSMMHGTNERVSIDNQYKHVQFMISFIDALTGKKK